MQLEQKEYFRTKIDFAENFCFAHFPLTSSNRQKESFVKLFGDGSSVSTGNFNGGPFGWDSTVPTDH